MKIITRIEAAKAGLKRYYTGKLCRHGHDSERYVINCGCVQCAFETAENHHAEIKRIMGEAGEDRRSNHEVV